MSSTPPLRIAAFRPRDGPAVRALVLAGMGERWGGVDESLNPDLDDVGASFADGYFACAWRGDELVGSGGFVAVPGCRAGGAGGETAQILRMSVAASARRRRVGTAVLEHLVDVARARGFERVVLETTDTWDDAVSFYERRGFRRVAHRDGEVWLARDIAEARA